MDILEALIDMLEDLVGLWKEGYWYIVVIIILVVAAILGYFLLSGQASALSLTISSL